jgi:hypothetical protein
VEKVDYPMELLGKKAYLIIGGMGGVDFSPRARIA